MALSQPSSLFPYCLKQAIDIDILTTPLLFPSDPSIDEAVEVADCFLLLWLETEVNQWKKIL